MKKENVDFSQINFFGSNPDSLQTPGFIVDIEGGSEIARVIISRPLWQDSPKGLHLFLNKQAESRDLLELNPVSMQTNNINEFKNRYSGLIVAMDKKDVLSNPFLIENGYLTRWIEKEGAVYIFEKKDQIQTNLGVEERKILMREAGVVKTSVIKTISEKYLVWEGRMEKSRSQRSPIDLTDEDYKYYEYTKRLWRQMLSEYKETGFKVVNPENSVLLDRLRRSKIPPNEWSLLKRGCGVELEGMYCSCHYQVTIKGEYISLKHCGGDHDFLTILEGERQKKLKDTYSWGESQLGEECKCGASIIETIWVEKEYLTKKGSERLQIGVERKCPHCGDPRVSYKRIPRSKLMGWSKK